MVKRSDFPYQKKEVITYDEAKRRYRNEIAKNTINTKSTPHYDSLYEYMDMLENSGWTVLNEEGY